MKHLALFLLLILAGCASDQDDADFFNRGWWRPERGANERLGLRPLSETRPGSSASQPADVAPSR